MHFSHGVMFCRIIFRGAVKRTVCAALVVRKRCSKPHRKDMRRKVSVFVSQRLRYAKFYGPGSEKLFDKQHNEALIGFQGRGCNKSVSLDFWGLSHRTRYEVDTF